MQVAVGLPYAVPSLVSEQGYLPKDCLLPGDSTTPASLISNFFVDTDGGCFQTKWSTVTPVGGRTVPVVRMVAPAVPPAVAVVDFAADEDNQAFDRPRPLGVEPTAAVVSVPPHIEAAAPDAPTVVLEPAATSEVVEEVDVETYCHLENCDLILPNLYLGGSEAALNSSRLADQGVRSLVCCMRELEFPDSNFIPELEYYRVDVEDMGREPIELFLPEATAFIHKELLVERPVLVHCKAGVSRSATVLLAYLMEYRGYSLHDAFALTLRHRPTITPNPGFIERLRDYEKEVCAASIPSICIRKYLEWFQASERDPEPDFTPEL